MSKIRDTDYLTISARVRAMENRLVTRERMERMVEARSDDEAVKVLTECGYAVSYTHLDVYKRQALACTLCLCASLTLPAAAAGGYTDVPGGAWYESAVNEVTEKGYMTGVSESQFAPTANVTRATVVTVLWRMEGSPAPTACLLYTSRCV